MSTTSQYNPPGNRNSNTSFWRNLKQQTLPAWQPIINGKTVSPTFLAFGLLLIPLGVVAYLISNNIQEISIDYTNCISSLASDNGEICANIVASRKRNCTCVIPFEISKDYKGKVYMYYGLTNFYQNHREYTESRDDDQFLGNIGSYEYTTSPSKDCKPFDKDENGLYIIPCGATANSMFNDTIKLFLNENESVKKEIPLIRKGIAWENDKKYKFKNPKQFSNKDDLIWKKFTSPRDWGRTIWDLDPEDENNNGLQNEDFIVWMRLSALSSFRKLYRIIDSGKLKEKDGLSKGKYSFEILYEYEVKSFGGTKSVILSETSSLLGGRNSQIGIILMSSGGVIMLLGLCLLCSSVKYGRSSLKHINGSIHTAHTDYGTTRRPTTVIRNKSQ